MYTHGVTVGFFTVLGMVCCLALGGFASPSAAEVIVVTTLTDTADPPFNTDGPCGMGTISDLPGIDGLVSLREAIIAANTTPDTQTITFAPSLSGGTIVVNFDDLDADTTPDPLPALCGGHTRIDGDLDGDGIPDITLDGMVFSIPAPPAVPTIAAAAGISVLSSHNTIHGLWIQQFPIGIRILAGDFTNPGTVTHTRVTHNIVAQSKRDGIVVSAGNVPGSRVAHTTITQNLLSQNTRNGILIVTSLSAAGSDSHIDHISFTDNEVTNTGAVGINLVSAGDHNIVSDALVARNAVSGPTPTGINLMGGFNGADENTFEVRIRDNTVINNGLVGIRVIAGQDNSSNNRVVARLDKNTVENHQWVGIVTIAGEGAINFPTGTSTNNVLDVRIERNTVKNQSGTGISVVGGLGSLNGRANAIADNNQTIAIVKHNTVEGSTDRGIELFAGATGLASANTTEAWVAHNTVCNNGTDILGEGGSTGNAIFPVPNMGGKNVLTGKIFQNTATTVMVEDGVLGNTATVSQFKNDPCP
jgi:Right handed beta helix region